MSNDEWVLAAMADENLVAEVLVSLRHHGKPPPPPQTKVAPALRLDWTVRQRRSRSVPRNDVEAKKKGDSNRASPSTPLSWSGGTSVSGGGGIEGCEESSKLIEGLRSKVPAMREKTTTKRSRRKKTLAELKEEESLLLKERRVLRNEFETMKINIEERRATNESLKRMKLDLQSQESGGLLASPKAAEETILNQLHQTASDAGPSTVSPTNVACKNTDDAGQAPQPNDTKQQEVESQAAVFVLPDLNMPIVEEPSSETLYGLS